MMSHNPAVRGMPYIDMTGVRLIMAHGTLRTACRSRRSLGPTRWK